jgi:hypothetical protein
VRAARLLGLLATLALAPTADANAQQVELISGGSGAGVATFSDASDDGSLVVFESDEKLEDSDTDTVRDVYARGRDGTLTHVSDGPTAADPNVAASFAGMSRDGTRIFFETPERLLTSDTDDSTDLYQRTSTGALTHLSERVVGADDAMDALFAGASRDGSRVFIETSEPLIGPDDTDTASDVYERAASGALTLISDDASPLMDAEEPAFFVGSSDDGTRVFLLTAERLAGNDGDSEADLYERGPGGLRHLSDGALGADAEQPVDFAGALSDGTRVFFATLERLTSSDGDNSLDGYARAPTGPLVHVTDGPGPDAEVGAALLEKSADGSRAFFQTTERLLPSDTDDANDIYERGPGGLRHVSDGPVEPDLGLSVQLTGASSDGRRLFLGTREALLPDDGDTVRDVYERGPEDELRLVSDDAGGVDAALPADFVHASRDGARVTFQTAEALAAGDTDDAPDVYQRTPAGVLVHVSDNQLDPDADLAAFFSGASADGGRVFFESDERLTAADVDNVTDVYAATVLPDPSPVGPGPPVGEPPRGDPTDTTRPRLSRARLARRRFVGRTVLRFTLSEPATVRLRIERALPGRRVGRSCRAPSRRNRARRRCTRYVAAGRRTVRGRAGANAVRLRGGRRGAYRLTLTAVDAAGNVSRRARLPFTVVAGKRRR